jgi:ATP synthase protein I
VGDDPEKERLRALDERIARARKAQEPPPRSDEHYSRAQLAWRMVIELVAGLAIGFGIGIGLDVLLGTMPLFLVLFILLGFAAGVRVMMRTAQEVTVADERRADEGRNGD